MSAAIGDAQVFTCVLLAFQFANPANLLSPFAM
jgi:hypothetical protein